MRNRLIILVSLTLFVAACVSTPPAKKSRSVKDQHDRAQTAFDELEGRPGSTSSSPSQSPPRRPDPEPVYTKPAPSDPDPVEETTAMDFSSSKYLTAEGFGQSKPESIRQAKAELSNIFEARISSDVSSKVKQVTSSAKGSSFTKSIESKVRVQSDIQLEGVRVGESKKKFGEYVTVAAIDKYSARDKWTREIEKIDTEINVLLNKSNRATSKIVKLLPLKKVLDLWVNREVVLSRLRVIGFASDIEEKDLAKILETISGLKSSMLIYLDVSGTHGSTVRDLVAEILTDNGFKITDSKNGSDVLISGSVTIQKVNNNNPRFKFSRATVSLNIIDHQSNTQVGQVSENNRGAHLNYDEAAHNAVKKVSSLVSDKLVQYFN